MGAIRTAFLALLCSLVVVPQALLQQTEEDVYPGVQALLLLKASLDPTFTGLPSWDPATSPCTWQGLTCNAQGVITAIDLSGLGLSGQLPLDARIWGALPNVTTVNLSNNSIQGYVPPQLDRLKAAQNLNVRDNGLQGPLPDLAGLGHLQNIHLDNNQMTGTLPAGWGSATLMKNLTLGNNTLTGTLPAGWSDLGALRLFDGSRNFFSGTVPGAWRNTSSNGTVQGMTALTTLLLGDNPSLCAVQQNPQYYNAQLANLTLPSHYQGPCQHGGALSTVAAPAPAPGVSALAAAPAPGALQAALGAPAPGPLPASVAQAPALLSAPTPAPLPAYSAGARALPPAPGPALSALSLPAPAPGPVLAPVAAPVQAPVPEPVLAPAAAPVTAPVVASAAAPAQVSPSPPEAAPASAPVVAPAPVNAPAPASGNAPAPGLASGPGANVSLQLSGLSAQHFAEKEGEYNHIVAQAAGVPDSAVTSTVQPESSSASPSPSTPPTAATGRRLLQSGPITVNSHINTNNPQQAQQGFQTAATGGTLGSGLQGIGLNYVPGSAGRSSSPSSPPAEQSPPPTPTPTPAATPAPTPAATPAATPPATPQPTPAATASPSPAQAQTSGAVVPSPAPVSSASAQPQSSGAGSGKGRPGWQIAVIVVAVIVGVFLAANAVLIPYLLVKRHRRKQSELHGKYLKSEQPNPEFEHDEGRGGAGGGMPNGGSGAQDAGNAVARGDDYERLPVKKDGATAAGAGPVTPRSAKASTPRGGAAAAAGAGAGAGVLGSLLGRKKKGGKGAEPLLSTGETSFTSAKSGDSFNSAKSRPQSVAGSFRSAQGAPGTSSGRPSDNAEIYGDAAGRNDSFASAKSFGEASSAVSAKSFTSARSAGNRDFFDSEEGNRESFDYSKPTRSTANPLYNQEDVGAAAAGAGAGAGLAAAGMPGRAPPTHNPLYASSDSRSVSAHPVSPSSTPTRGGSRIASGTATPASVHGHPVTFDSGSEGGMSRTGSQPGSPMGSASKSGSQPGTPHDLQGHPVAFDSGSAGQGSLMGSRAGSQDMGSVQGHPVAFDSGSDIGSVPNSAPTSEPNSPRAGSVQGHPVGFDSGFEMGSNMGSSANSPLGSGTNTPKGALTPEGATTPQAAPPLPKKDHGRAKEAAAAGIGAAAGGAMAAATAGKPKEPSPGQTSKNSPYTLTPADSLGTPGQASTASGSQRSSADEPRAPATTPDPKRPVSFDFGQGPPRGPRDSMDAGSDLAPGSELPSPMGSRPTSMDYGAAATAPPPSLAGRQHPSDSDLSSWNPASARQTPQSSRPTSMDYGPRAPPPSVRGYALGSDIGSDVGSNIGSLPPSGRPSFDIGGSQQASVRGYALGSDLGSNMGSNIGSEMGSAPPSGRPSFEIGTGRAPPPSVRGYALGSDMGSDMGSEIGSAPASGRPSFDIGEGRPSFDIGDRPVRQSFDIGSGRPSFDFGGARAAGLVSRPIPKSGSGSNLTGSGSQTPASTRPGSMDYQFRAPPPSVQGHELGSDIGSDVGSDMGSRPASMDYGPRAPPPSLAGGRGDSRSDLQSMGGRPSFEIGGSGRPSFEIGGGERPSFDIGSGRPSFDISGMHNLPQGQGRGLGPQGHQVAFSDMGSNMGSNIGSAAQTPGATPQPSRPASMDYGPRSPAPPAQQQQQQGGAATPGSLQGHQVAFSDFGSDIGSNIGSIPGSPIGSRPASMDYGRRDAPLQGIPERAEGVEGHRLNFDSGSEMGSEMGSRPGSGPPSPTAGARGEGGLRPHAVTFDSGSEIGSEMGSQMGSAAPSPGPSPGSRSPAGGRSQSPAPRSPLIGGSTMTSTNPAFASNLYDSTYSADSEGQRNPMYEAGGTKTPEEGKSNPLFSSNILDSSGSLQGERERRNPLYDSQQSTASQKSAKTSADPAESASSRFRSLFKRRDRAETS